MINILCTIPVQYDQTSFYRGMEPMKRLEKQFPTLISCDYRTQGDWQHMSWADLSGYDILFMQRPQREDEKLLISMAKEMGLKTWFDYDDDLLNVPLYHRFHGHFVTPERNARIKEIMKQADVISVTNEILRTKFLDINKNVVVIPNALNDYLDFGPVTLGTNDNVTWRGSITHEIDVYSYKEAIIKNANRGFDWQFKFMGDRFVFLYMEIKNFQHVPETPIPNYLRNIKSLNSKVHIVPLLDDEFNRSKSNIAYLESTWAGSVCLCPDFEAWQDSTVKYRSADEFDVQLKFLMDLDDEKREAIWKKDWETIQSKYLLSKVNENRMTLIETLSNRKG